METYLTAEMIKALSEGDVPRFVAYIAIFVFIWIEVRGLKKEVGKLNETISKSFAEGEARFEKVEDNVVRIDQRLTLVEQKITPRGI
jgi:hypothetical protein